MLKKYIELMADRLKNGTKAYLCPACMETVIIAKILQREYSAAPSGFCDNDVKKQGKYLNSRPDIKIISFEEALRDGTSEFLIVSPHHAAEIMGSLAVGHGVPETRIINFQPVERRKTCAFYAHNWIIHEEHFTCCCAEGFKPEFENFRPDPYRGALHLEQVRRELIDCEARVPELCRNCYNYGDHYIYKSRRLNSFNFSFLGWCNYKCGYCSANQPDLAHYDNGFVLTGYLEELERLDAVNDVFSVLFAVGEPTLNEKRFGLYEHCREKQYFLDVFSNCSVFDESLFQLAQDTPVIIRKSFDAGTPETYAKIKGVNCYAKMLENVRRYCRAPYFALNPKYLFVPGVNDNETDIKNFVNMCAELRIDFATPVFNLLNDEYARAPHTQKMFKLLVDELAENNIFTANVDTLYSKAYHDLYAKSF